MRNSTISRLSRSPKIYSVAYLALNEIVSGFLNQSYHIIVISGNWFCESIMSSCASQETVTDDWLGAIVYWSIIHFLSSHNTRMLMNYDLFVENANGPIIKFFCYLFKVGKSSRLIVSSSCPCTTHEIESKASIFATMHCINYFFSNAQISDNLKLDCSIFESRCISLQTFWWTNIKLLINKLFRVITTIAYSKISKNLYAHLQSLVEAHMPHICTDMLLSAPYKLAIQWICTY